MKSHELYAAVDPVIITQMLDWFRANDRNVYKVRVDMGRQLARENRIDADLVRGGGLQ